MGWMSENAGTTPFDLEKGVKFVMDDASSVKVQEKDGLAGNGVLLPGDEARFYKGICGNCMKVETPIATQTNRGTPDNHKKKSSKKPPKPPKPPRSLLLNEADEKLMKEISELASLKRARIERMKALKKMKDAKTSSSSSTSSYGNFLATIFTIFLCLVVMFQGMPPNLNTMIPVTFRASKLIEIPYTGDQSSS